jgi:P4 family phage/plasmid primase-like protien
LPQRIRQKVTTVDDTERNAVGSGGAVPASGKTNEEKPKRKPSNGRTLDDGARVNDAAIIHRGDEAELAVMLLDQLRAMNTGAIVHDEGDLYQYDPRSGLWKIVDFDAQGRILIGWRGRETLKNKHGLTVNHSTIEGTIKTAAILKRIPGFFAKAPAGIAFRNGFVAVEPKGLVLRGHVPDNRARWGHPFDYNPDLDCPLFKAFLGDMFAANADRDELIACLQEWIGIALIGKGAKFGKALIIHAPKGRNGKKVLADIMTGIMPEGAVSASTPDTWSHEYYIEDLRGKLLNIVPEMDFRDISDAKRVKSIITGDPMQGRRIRKEIVKFEPIASHYWTTQELPGTPDNSYAFHERFIMFKLPDTIAREKRKLNLAAEIIAAEKPAIVAWTLAGAARALARGSYAIPASSDILVNKWLATADSLSWFIHEHCVTLTDSDPRDQWLASESLIEAYRDFAQKNGFRNPYNARNIKGKMEGMGLHQKRGNMGKIYPVRIRKMTDPYPDDGSDE